MRWDSLFYKLFKLSLLVFCIRFCSVQFLGKSSFPKFSIFIIDQQILQMKMLIAFSSWPLSLMDLSAIIVEHGKRCYPEKSDDIKADSTQIWWVVSAGPFNRRPDQIAWTSISDISDDIIKYFIFIQIFLLSTCFRNRSTIYWHSVLLRTEECYLFAFYFLADLFPAMHFWGILYCLKLRGESSLFYFD